MRKNYQTRGKAYHMRRMIDTRGGGRGKEGVEMVRDRGFWEG